MNLNKQIQEAYNAGRRQGLNEQVSVPGLGMVPVLPGHPADGRKLERDGRIYDRTDDSMTYPNNNGIKLYGDGRYKLPDGTFGRYTFVNGELQLIPGEFDLQT